jgi:thioredoxin-like negative regulator of GroEL
MEVVSCKSANEYIGAIGNAGDSPVLAEFYAEWSIPSQVLSQELDSLCADYPGIIRLRLNFNDCPVFIT